MSMHRKKLISAAVTTAISSTILIPTANAQETAEGAINLVEEVNTDDMHKTIENETQNDNIVNDNIEAITGQINNTLQDVTQATNTYKNGLEDSVDSSDGLEENTHKESSTNKNDVDTIKDNNISSEIDSQQITNEDKEAQKVDSYSQDTYQNKQAQKVDLHPQGTYQNKQGSQPQSTLRNNEDIVTPTPQISYAYQPEEYIPEIKKYTKIQQEKYSENIQDTIEKTNNITRDVAKNFVLPTISLSALPISLIYLKNNGTKSNINVNSQVNQLIDLLEKNNVPVHDIIAKSPKKVRQAIDPYYTVPNTKPVEEKITYASKHVSASQPKTSTQSQKAVGFAHSRIGTPYVYGGTTDAGYDCSGFVQAAYRSAGVNIPRTTQEQANYGRSVSRAELQPGDLVFYGNGGPSSSYHAAIYVGNGQVIHSPQTGDSVKKANIDMMRISAMKRPV